MAHDLDGRVNVAAWPKDRAVRNTSGLYPGTEHGKRAIDGSLLDVSRSDGNGKSYALASAWRPAEGTCPWCIAPEFVRLVPETFRRCPQHGRLPRPERDPFPMDDTESFLAEQRAWPDIAEAHKIPSRYWTVSIEQSRPTPAIKVMDEIDDGTDQCIVLAGPTGTGKTHAMIAGFRRSAIWYRSACVYWTFPALVRALISDGSDEVLERAIEADLLAIDDMGSTYLKPDGVAEASIEEILVSREANEALTLLTTNLTLVQFRDVFGDRISDRIAGDWGDWHAITGDSMRTKTRRPARG
jgi:hypothetical protein